MMNRRGLLRAVAILPAASLLACQPGGPAPAQFVSDVQLLLSGLTAAIASIKQIPGVPAPAVATLEDNLSRLQTEAAAITVATGKLSPSTVQEIGQVVEAVASVALPLLPGGSAIELTIEAAVAILPPIMAAAGISGIGKKPELTPDQARAILAAAR
jgi:hypothetical protein